VVRDAQPRQRAEARAARRAPDPAEGRRAAGAERAWAAARVGDLHRGPLLGRRDLAPAPQEDDALPCASTKRAANLPLVARVPAVDEPNRAAPEARQAGRDDPLGAHRRRLLTLVSIAIIERHPDIAPSVASK